MWDTLWHRLQARCKKHKGPNNAKFRCVSHLSSITLSVQVPELEAFNSCISWLLSSTRVAQQQDKKTPFVK